MRLFVTVNGYLVGELEYELPKRPDGTTIALLPKAHWSDIGAEAQVMITDGDGHEWVARGAFRRV